MYNQKVLPVVIAVLLISLIPVFVGLIALRLPAFKKSSMWFFVSFAAGVMLGNAFYDLLPESVANFGNASILSCTLMGIIFFYLMEKYFLWHTHEFGGDQQHRTSAMVMLGDTLHNFVDGIVIAGAFLMTPALGIATSLAIAFHEIPQEVADFSILVSGGTKAKKAIVLNFLSGLVALLGGILGYTFLSIAAILIPYLTAFAAGMFIYIACSDLIPRTHEWDKSKFDIKTVISFLAGIALIKILALLLP